MKVRYKSPASRELQASFEWYMRQSPFLGGRFLDAIEKTIERMRQFPQAFPASEDGVRSAPVAGFPYALRYTLVEGEILIYAVSHMRRAPRYWSDQNT